MEEQPDDAKDEYVKGIDIMLEQCNDLGLLDLIMKLLLKSTKRGRN